jgi:hypothetical protein
MPSSRVTSDKSKITRRQIASLIAVAPALAAQPAAPQTPPSAPPAQTNPDSLAKAQAQVREVSESLRKMEIPMDSEPAFTFRP